MSEQSMVDNVANAIRRNYRVSTFVPIPDSDPIWADLARAAIEAMRILPPEIMMAGLAAFAAQAASHYAHVPVFKEGDELTERQMVERYMKIGATLVSGDQMEHAWDTMISAMLAEPSPALDPTISKE